MDQVLAEYMSRCDSGELPDREEFLGKHPELRDQLSELLNAADWIESMAGPTADSLSGNGDVASTDAIVPGGQSIDPNRTIEDTLPHFNAAQGLNPFNTDETVSGQGKKKVDSRSKVELSQPILPCQFGDYVLERVLGRGGMGVVYFGHQSQLDRPVAVKMIRSGALASDEEVERFYAEARSAAKLHHPNIVTVYQCGEQDGHRFFSMDYVPGSDLSQLIKSGPMDGRTAARHVRDVARAIQYAHDQGILHRDLKPANILVDETGAVRITDFGLAKSIGADSGLTAEGAALGTPSYMSPEQAAGKTEEQHHATDTYSLGAILFTLVTGKPPFKAPTIVETIMHVIHRPAPRARSINSNVHPDIETIVDVCLQKSPERRYASAKSLADDLDRYLEGSPIQARPMSRFRRSWYWLLGVPIFGAVLDRRVVEPTEAHRWVQRGLISVGLLMLLAWLALMLPANLYRNRMPSTVRVASGLRGGSYEVVAQSICDGLGENEKCNALAINTNGSVENADRLERGLVDLALLQGDVIGSQQVAVVTPLYYEAVHILIRKDAGIRTLQDLGGRNVNIGPLKAGSRGIAELVLENAGLSIEDIHPLEFDWHQLISSHLVGGDSTDAIRSAELATIDGVEDSGDEGDSDNVAAETVPIDAAIVVSRLGSSDVAELLGDGEFELLPFNGSWEFALLEPMFRPMRITSNHYPDCGLPDDGVEAVTATAFLAARQDAPSVLVQAVLRHLFTPEIIAATGIVTAERAAHWQGLVWHPAAREFFESYRGLEPKLSLRSSAAESAILNKAVSAGAN